MPADDRAPAGGRAVGTEHLASRRPDGGELRGGVEGGGGVGQECGGVYRV
jgi:hypothetical protein